MNFVVTTLAPSFLIGSFSFLQGTRKPIIFWMGSKFDRIRQGTYDLPALEVLEKSQTNNGGNVVTTLVLSILNGYSSFLQTIRTTIKA